MKHIYSFRRKVPFDRSADINVREVVYCSGINHLICVFSCGIVCFKCMQRGHNAASSNVDEHVSNVMILEQPSNIADLALVFLRG